MKYLKTGFTDYVVMALVYLLGGGSLLLFMIFLLFGSLNLINLGLSNPAILILNTALSLLFFIQHSGMVRKSFRQWLERYFSKQYDLAIYSIASGIVLIISVLFWQETTPVLFSIQGIFRWLLRAVSFLSFVGFIWGMKALGPFDPFGVKPIWQNLHDIKSASIPFTIRGPYRWVRHPLYFFSLLMIWACPDITMDRLLFNVLWTAWIYIGSVLEERDLIADFGSDYRNYQRNVPMLIPWRITVSR